MHRNSDPCNSFFRVNMASGIDRGHVRPTSTKMTSHNMAATLQLLNNYWVGFRDIQNNQGRGKVISRSRRLRLITLTETLIILDITKTVESNFLLLLYTERKKKWKSCFLLLHWWKATQKVRTWHDYPRPWVSLTWLFYNPCSYDATGADFEYSLYSFSQSGKS